MSLLFLQVGLNEILDRSQSCSKTLEPTKSLDLGLEFLAIQKCRDIPAGKRLKDQAGKFVVHVPGLLFGHGRLDLIHFRHDATHKGLAGAKGQQVIAQRIDRRGQLGSRMLAQRRDVVPELVLFLVEFRRVRCGLHSLADGLLLEFDALGLQHLEAHLDSGRLLADDRLVVDTLIPALDFRPLLGGEGCRVDEFRHLCRDDLLVLGHADLLAGKMFVQIVGHLLAGHLVDVAGGELRLVRELVGKLLQVVLEDAGRARPLAKSDGVKGALGASLKHVIAQGETLLRVVHVGHGDEGDAAKISLGP